MSCFRLAKKIIFDGVFFFYKGKPILSAFKQKILNEFKKSNGMKPPKYHF